MTSQSASRRTVLCGAALAGAAGLGAAACGPEGSGKKASPTPTAPVDLGPADAVPAGGAKIYREDRVVVSRTAEDQYTAFSAVCTHRGCVVDSVENGKISCPCHGSVFDARTGKVLQGPAVAPLPSVPVRTKGGKLVAGPDA
ncbi:Rieske (2Fe-2S) protein [Streptomyces botrytidirepellens]|uniref:Cytochrome bc1 complex Rieske iron-sulfur subunit n=1 Tax=Streptomyces botrytidirepellens TaxID=2486417 RepID=A0A3M8SNN2_9ACTN|nr:Rieske (2Fe-2S) protein [Streptomyces botrytidirepellens]RNF82295.1 Rieske (2Fe-2S) protein [Streptomyces botrytidirepellens]